MRFFLFGAVCNLCVKLTPQLRISGDGFYVIPVSSPPSFVAYFYYCSASFDFVDFSAIFVNFYEMIFGKSVFFVAMAPVVDGLLAPWFGRR